MPTKRAATLLSSDVAAALFGLPDTTESVIRHCTLDDEDRSLVFARRGAHNRLGFAVQLCALRYPGRLLTEGATPPDMMLRFLANQVDAAPSDFDRYGRGTETGRRHAAELLGHLSLRRASVQDRRAVMAKLENQALDQDDPGYLLAEMVAGFREAGCTLPSLATMERDCRDLIARTRRTVWTRLTAGLDAEQTAALDALLTDRADQRVSVLAWLRHAPQAARPGQIGSVFDRLERIRAVGIDRARRDLVPRRRFETLVEEARRVPVQHLAGRYGALRRRALLIAAAIDLEETLTDHGLDLMGRFLGNLFNRSDHAHAAGMQSRGKAIAEQLRMHAALVETLDAAKAEGTDAFSSIEAHLGWARVLESAGLSKQLVAGEAFNPLSELPERYGILRPVAARFLSLYQFESAPAAASTLRAVDALRSAWAKPRRRLPENPPTAFVGRRWTKFVFGKDSGIDERHYAFCAVEALFNRLRAGDIWVAGSRNYASFEDGLIAPEAWAHLVETGDHGLAVETDFPAFCARITEKLDGRLSEIDRRATDGTLPDAAINETGLRIGRTEGLETAKQAEPVARRLYASLPSIRITDLLIEVDRWTGFASAFTHLRTGREAGSRQALFSALLAEGTNMSLTRMAEAAQGPSVRQLAWTADWHIRPETYANALARIVDAQHRHPLAAWFGESVVASSDGQHFRAGGHGEARNLVNAKYGKDPGAAIYTHITGRYGPVHSTLIPPSAGEAAHVLGGLLNHRCDLAIETQHMDTGGVNDHLFAMGDMLGYRIAPRIRNLKERRLYSIAKPASYPTLAPIIDSRVNMTLLEAAWSDTLRFAASVKAGAIPAALAMKRLAAWPRQNHIAGGMREYGRIVRTLFILDWIDSPDLRRQTTEELNKGEGRNNLARAIFHNRLGELRERSATAQANRASGLNLIVSAIILWNTVYLERAIDAARTRGDPVPDHLVRHIAPLGWEHINLNGDFFWVFEKPKTPDGYRPLRNPNRDLLAA